MLPHALSTRPPHTSTPPHPTLASGNTTMSFSHSSSSCTSSRGSSSGIERALDALAASAEIPEGVLLDPASGTKGAPSPCPNPGPNPNPNPNPGSGPASVMLLSPVKLGSAPAAGGRVGRGGWLQWAGMSQYDCRQAMGRKGSECSSSGAVCHQALHAVARCERFTRHHTPSTSSKSHMLSTPCSPFTSPLSPKA